MAYDDCHWHAPAPWDEGATSHCCASIFQRPAIILGRGIIAQAHDSHDLRGPLRPLQKLKAALKQSHTILPDNRDSCAGIPVASRLLEGLPGYSLYKGAQMPFGPRSADFACAQSYTSKRICELPGNLTVSCSRLSIMTLVW